MNKVILIGRLTKNPEMRQTQSGTSVCGFTIAVDKRIKQGDEKKADFINCQAWQKTAEFITKYFEKGNKIAVVGRIETRTWEDKDGSKKYATEVIVEDAEFVESKKSDGNNHGIQNNSEFTTVEDDGDLPF